MVAAGESDARLEARLQQQQAAFSALSLDHAVAQMPRLQARPASPAACHLRRPAADALAPGPRGACVPSVPGSARVPGGRAQPENARRRGRRPW